MNERNLILFTFIVILFGIAIFISKSKPSIQTDKERFARLIDSEGPQRAFLTIKEQYEHADPEVAHTFVHLFGEVVYQKVGLSGIQTCNDSFGFACYHGFYIAAIQKHGKSVLSELEQECMKIAEYDLNCTHGIGHGVLEYIGHSKLSEALDTCSTLSTPGNKYGCKTGVFMEYNFPTLTNTDGSKTPSKRDFEEERPYEVCERMNSKHQRACYYGLGQYWAQLFSPDYSKIGKLCGGIRDESYRFACHFGMGTTIPLSTNNKLEAILKACTAMENDQNHDFCIKGVRWGLGPNYSDLSNNLCNYFIHNKSVQCQEGFVNFMIEEQ